MYQTLTFLHSLTRWLVLISLIYAIYRCYIELDPKKTYITVCSHGLRSVKAENILKERGFKHIYNGGAWTDLQTTIHP